MSGDILTVKTVKRVRSVRGSALVHIIILFNDIIMFGLKGMLRLAFEFLFVCNNTRQTRIVSVPVP